MYSHHCSRFRLICDALSRSVAPETKLEPIVEIIDKTEETRGCVMLSPYRPSTWYEITYKHRDRR